MHALAISFDSALCPLLGLPPELRNRIYEYALVREEEYILRNQATPPLLRTCRQIRDDASSLYYAHNTFYITDAKRLCLPWLKSVPAELRKHIVRVRLYTSCTLGSVEEALWKERWIQAIRRALTEAGLLDGCQLDLEVFIVVAGQLTWTSSPERDYCMPYWQRMIISDPPESESEESE